MYDELWLIILYFFDILQNSYWILKQQRISILDSDKLLERLIQILEFMLS